jgi:hypothetical protein
MDFLDRQEFYMGFILWKKGGRRLICWISLKELAQ